MPLNKLEKWIEEFLSALDKEGRLKGREDVIERVEKPSGGRGPRFFIEGEPGRGFIKMDSNSYLGLSFDPGVEAAGHKAHGEFGSGPGGVRFIHGTCKPHTLLEKKLADFHGKEAGIIFSSAYAAVCGTIAPLVSKDTAVLSDELNHNSIINAVRMSRPKDKGIYAHLDMNDLRAKIEGYAGKCSRLLIVTDGVFSMRGDYPDLRKLAGLALEYDREFAEGIVTVMDDSHGTGAFGGTGRGTTEAAGGADTDVIVSTLGKALGVNGGYAAASAEVVRYLRETSPFYIYSNPITPGEAASALKSLEILDSEKGALLLKRLGGMTEYLKGGLRRMGYEVLPGEHPITAVMIRDSRKTERIIERLFKRGILAVGIKHPVVPAGDECIRFQANACHTKADLDYVLGVMKECAEKPE